MGGLDLDGHLGQLELDRLVLDDRLAEGVPDLRVGDAQLKGAEGDSAAAGGDVDPADLDPVHHLVEALARGPAENPVGGDADVMQDQLGRVDALVAHLLDLPRHGQARYRGVGAEARLLLDQESGHVPVRRVVALVGPAQHRHQVGGAAVGQPHLLAVDHVVVPARLPVPLHSLGPGADRRDIRAHARLRHGEGAAHVAGRHPGQEVLLLLLCAVLADHVGDDEVGVDDARHRHPAAGDLLHHQRVGEQRLAQAAVLLGNGQPEQAELLHPLDDLGRVLVLVLKLAGDRDDLLVDELPHRGEDVPLDVGQAFGLREAFHGAAPFCWS